MIRRQHHFLPPQLDAVTIGSDTFYIKTRTPTRPLSALPPLTDDPATARLPEVPPLVQPARSSAPCSVVRSLPAADATSRKVAGRAAVVESGGPVSPNSPADALGKSSSG